MNEKTKLKKWSLAKWKKEFWKTFSKYIKLRDKGICYTCKVRCSGKNAHAGHFRPAGACGLWLYFHEDNVHCQCLKCNIHLQGNQYEYGKRLGEEKVKMLDKGKIEHKDLQYSKKDYCELIKKYELKIQSLKQTYEVKL